MLMALFWFSTNLWKNLIIANITNWGTLLDIRMFTGSKAINVRTFSATRNIKCDTCLT